MSSSSKYQHALVIGAIAQALPGRIFAQPIAFYAGESATLRTKEPDVHVAMCEDQIVAKIKELENARRDEVEPAWRTAHKQKRARRQLETARREMPEENHVALGREHENDLY